MPSVRFLSPDDPSLAGLLKGQPGPDAPVPVDPGLIAAVLAAQGRSGAAAQPVSGAPSAPAPLDLAAALAAWPSGQPAAAPAPAPSAPLDLAAALAQPTGTPAPTAPAPLGPLAPADATLAAQQAQSPGSDPFGLQTPAQPFSPGPQLAQRQPGEATLTPYDPSWRDKLRGGLQDALSGGGMSKTTAQMYADHLAGRDDGGYLAAADVVPVLGQALSGNQGYRSYQSGDYVGAALGALGALPFPGASTEGHAAMIGLRDAGGALKPPVDQGLSRLLGATPDLAIVKPPVPTPPPSITAYHGTPHDFDQFRWDPSTRGSGEGAQAFGDGLYFAEKEDVAKGYRDTLSNKTADLMLSNKPYKYDDLSQPEKGAFDHIRESNNDVGQAIGEAREATVKAFGRGDKADADFWTQREQQLRNWQAKGFHLGGKGHMYQVGINADPEHMLDWDKPFAEQSPVVQQAMDRVGLPEIRSTEPEGGSTYTQDHYLPGGTRQSYVTTFFDHGTGKWAVMRKGDGIGAVARRDAYQEFDSHAEAVQTARRMMSTGEAIHTGLVNRLGSPQAAAETLLNAGIPGVRYLDRMSRGAGTGSRNYVVFDAKHVEILRKYLIAMGLGGTVAAAGALAQPGQAEAAEAGKYGPVDFDPFAAAGTPTGKPAEQYGPVDFDPFAPKASSPLAVASDVAKSAGTGLARGVMGVVGAPGDTSDLVDHGVSWLIAKAAEKLGMLPAGKTADDFIRDAQALDLPRSKLDAAFSAPRTAGIEKVVSSVTGPLYEPQTTAGRYAETIGEFAPGAMIGPGSTVSKLAKFAVAPGVAAEGAGDLTGDNPWARAIAGMAAGGGAAFLTGPGAVTRKLADASRGASGPTLDAAQDLMERAHRLGAPITLAEAIQQVTNNGTGMGRLQRVIEGTEEGASVLSPVFAKRPQSNADAMARALDAISPPTDQPSALGVRGQQAARGVLDDVGRRINGFEQPYYDAASTKTVPPKALQYIAQDPAFQEALSAVRASPIKNKDIANFPANEVPVLIAVRKELARMEQDALTPGLGVAADRELARGITPVREQLDKIITGAAPEYGQALGVGAGLRDTVKMPIEAGPIGRMAATDDTLAHTRALFPGTPLEGAPAETGKAIGLLNQQNPAVAPGLVRQHLATRYADATKDLVGGQNQWGAAKFRAQLAGNDTYREALAAALRALPNGPAAEGAISPLLEVFAAQGKRQAPGSLTAFNERDLSNLAAPGPVTAAMQAVATLDLFMLWDKVKTGLDQWRLGSRSEELARALIAPPEEAIGAVRDAQLAAPEGARRRAALALALGAHSQTALDRSKERAAAGGSSH